MIQNDSAVPCGTCAVGSRQPSTGFGEAPNRAGLHSSVPSGLSHTLFGMGNDIADDVGVVDDVEVKPPAAGHAGLPDAGDFVIFLGAQGRVAEILLQEFHLFEESPPHFGRSVFQSLECTGKVVNLHWEGLGECLALFAAALFRSWRS